MTTLNTFDPPEPTRAHLIIAAVLCALAALLVVAFG